MAGSDNRLTPRSASSIASPTIRIAAVAVAAGTGSRFGAEISKQYLTVTGKTVIRHGAETLAAHVSLIRQVGDPEARRLRAQSSGD